MGTRLAHTKQGSWIINTEDKMKDEVKKDKPKYLELTLECYREKLDVIRKQQLNLKDKEDNILKMIEDLTHETE